MTVQANVKTLLSGKLLNLETPQNEANQVTA